MLSCVIQGSLALTVNSLISFSWPLPPQLAMITITPSIRSLPTTFRSSGAPLCPPLAMTAMRPLPRPISESFSSTSLESGPRVVSINRTSGRALRTFCTMEVASASGGVNTSSTTSFKPSLSKPPSRIGLGEVTGGAGLSLLVPHGFCGRRAGHLRELQNDGQRILGHLAGGGRGLEHVLVSTPGDLIGVRQREPWDARAFGHLGDRQRERADEGSRPANQIRVLRQHPLRRILGLLGGVSGVDDNQLHLRPAERLAAARCVDVLHRELGALQMQLAVARPRARERDRNRDLHFLGLGKRRICTESRDP